MFVRLKYKKYKLVYVIHNLQKNNIGEHNTCLSFVLLDVVIVGRYIDDITLGVKVKNNKGPQK